MPKKETAKTVPQQSKPLELKDIFAPSGNLDIAKTVLFTWQQMAKAAASDNNKRNLSPAEYEKSKNLFPVPLLASGKPFPKEGIDIDRYARELARALAKKDTKDPPGELNFQELPKPTHNTHKHHSKTHGRKS